MKFASPSLAIATLLIAAVSFAPAATAQSRVYEKDLKGEWKMVFDLDKTGDSALERIVMSAVDGFMDEIDIRFQFLPDHLLLVNVKALDEDEEQEESEWHINAAGQLVLGETDHFDTDDVWMMLDGKLQAYDLEDGELAEPGKRVYLERVR